MCDRHDCVHRLSRRSLLVAGAAALAAGVRPPRPAWAASPEAAPGATAPNAISPDEALQRLMDGNARYAANVSTNKDFSAGRAARACWKG